MAFNSDEFWKKTRAHNRAVNRAKNRIREAAGRNLQKHTEGYSDELLANLRVQTRADARKIYVIKLAVLRYGIIREVGAGRGWPGGRQETEHSEKPRRPAPWLEETFKDEVPKLANSLSKIQGDEMVAYMDHNLGTTKSDLFQFGK